MTKVARRTLSRKRKAAIHERHGGICHICGDYVPLDEAEFDHVIALALCFDDTDDNLGPAHVPCHAKKTKGDVKQIAKAKRVFKKHHGLVTRRKAIVPGSKASKWKKKLNGTVERRVK